MPAGHDVADLALAPAGAERISYAEQAMPVLARLGTRLARDRPLAGLAVAACMHVTAETAVLLRTLAAAGARVAVAASNPLATRDDVAAALVARDGVAVFARHGVDRDGYRSHLRAALAAGADLLLDDGCDLVSLLQAEPALAPRARAGCEETATGVLRLRQMAAEGELRLPMVAVNDTPVQLLVANRHGTGQSTWDAVLQAADVMLAGAVVVVAGYGRCGRGIAERARGLGARVLVTEVDPGRALEAVLDGHQVLPMTAAAPLGDVFVTSTGCRDVLTGRHFELMHDGAVLANAGHFDIEIDVAGLAAAGTRRPVRPHVDEYLLPGGRRIRLVAHGRVVNLAAGEGHPAAVMDVSFAVQALSLEWLAGADLPVGVHPVPPRIDAEVAATRLAVSGVSLDTLTAVQERYLSTWR